MSRSTATILYRLLLLVGILALWQFASGRLISAFFISSPAAVAQDLWRWTIDGTLAMHAWVTAVEAFGGFLLGSILGVGVGVLLARAGRLADVLGPFINAFYSLPKVALAPLFVLWFGIGMDMKVIMTAAVVFFLVFLNTYTGVRNVSPELIAILRLMGANERHLLGKVILPSAVTWVFTGLRISVPYALIGAIVGELVAANRGLGFLLADSAGQFDTAGVFAALAAIMALSALLGGLVRLVERRAIPWKTVGADREVTV